MKVDQTVTKAKRGENQFLVDLNLFQLFISRQFGQVQNQPTIQLTVVFFRSQEVSRPKSTVRSPEQLFVVVSRQVRPLPAKAERADQQAPSKPETHNCFQTCQEHDESELHLLLCHLNRNSQCFNRATAVFVPLGAIKVCQLCV